MANGIINKHSSPICPVDASGRFTAEVPDFARVYVKDADKLICANLKQRGRLVHQGTINHSYPFCWRFVRVLVVPISCIVDGYPLSQ